MFKKTVLSFIIVFLLIIVTGCGSDNSSNGLTAKPDTKGKCDVFECINLVELNDNYNQVVSKIGFEGELKGDNHYYWDLSSDTGIEVYFYDSGNNISIDFPNKMIIKRANFSKWDEIKSKVDSNEGLSYEELVKLVGGVEGVLTDKKSGMLTYKWLDENGGYLSAIFDRDTMKCSWISAWF